MTAMKNDKLISLEKVLAEIGVMPIVKAEGHDFIEKTCLIIKLGLQPAELRWIPVTERLPEKDGKYYVTQLLYNVYDPNMTGAYIRKTDYIWYSTLHKKWFSKGNCKVVAWMELPESWKGKNEEYKDN